jgi:hypothetical protein
MKPDDLDRILLREAKITPSSGFARSVMAAVRNEATAPPPIPFPWKRALPGLAACGVAIGWNLMDVSRSPVPKSASVTSIHTQTLTQTLTQSLDGAGPVLSKALEFGTGWALLGVLLTFAGLKLTWRLSGWRV